MVLDCKTHTTIRYKALTLHKIDDTDIAQALQGKLTNKKKTYQTYMLLYNIYRDRNSKLQTTGFHKAKKQRIEEELTTTSPRNRRARQGPQLVGPLTKRRRTTR